MMGNMNSNLWITTTIALKYPHSKVGSVLWITKLGEIASNQTKVRFIHSRKLYVAEHERNQTFLFHNEKMRLCVYVYVYCTIGQCDF